MTTVSSMRVLLFSVVALTLAGCGWVAKNKANNKAGVRVSEVVWDMKKTSDKHKQEEHEQRVEELESEYEEFVRSKEEIDTDDNDEERSIMIIKDEQN